jgi:molybdenum cofactor cytidylyltransferase
MLGSVRCGLRALPPECDAVLLALGDQPAIRSALINEMLRAFDATGKGILVPVYEGKRGHPLLFSARYRDEILRRYDDIGLRGLLQVHSDNVLELAAASATVLSGMDCPEDYRREIRRLAEEKHKDTHDQRPPKGGSAYVKESG